MIQEAYGWTTICFRKSTNFFKKSRLKRRLDVTDADEALHEAMPGGREGILLLPPDPDDPYGDIGLGWAIARGRYSYRADTREYVVTRWPLEEEKPLTDEELADGLLQPQAIPLVEDCGLEEYETVDHLLGDAFDFLIRCLTGKFPNELHTFAYHLRSLALLARDLQMPLERLLAHVQEQFEYETKE